MRGHGIAACGFDFFCVPFRFFATDIGHQNLRTQLGEVLGDAFAKSPAGPVTIAVRPLSFTVPFVCALDAAHTEVLHFDEFFDTVL